MSVVLLTPFQVSQRCGLARSTLAKFRLRGDGPKFVKIGAAVRYREDDLEEWLEKHPRRRSTSDSGPEAVGKGR